MAIKSLDLLITTMESDVSGFRFGQEALSRSLSFVQLHYHQFGPTLSGLPKEISPTTRWLPRRPMATNNISDNHFGIFTQLLTDLTWGSILDQGLYTQELMSLEDKIGKRWFIMATGLAVADLVDPNSHSWTYPVIARKRYAGRSKANFLLESLQDWQQFRKKHNPDNYCFERFYELSGDYRVLLVGEHVLGVLERTVQIKKEKRVVVKGAGKAELPGKILQQCRLLKQHIGADFLGVDVGKRRDGSYFFIEYNFSPQFLAFERETNINAAGAVIDFLLHE